MHLFAAFDSGDESSIAVGVQQRHGALGEIAALVGLPLVVGVGQDRADQADDGGFIRAPLSSSGGEVCAVWTAILLV